MSINSVESQSMSMNMSYLASNAAMVSAWGRDLVELNNGAVEHCVLQGNLQGAVLVLQHALVKLASCRPPMTSFDCIPRKCMVDSPILTSVQVKCDLPLRSCDDIFAFYNRAVLLPRDEGAFDVSLPENWTRAQATIQYNLGLCYHVEGLRTGESQAFKIALQHYGSAFGCVQREYGVSQDVSMLLLALFNNTGHIHAKELVNPEKTRQCLRQVQATFSSPEIKQALSPEDFSFFLQYISIVSHAQLVLAPAA